jgi:hypothetical protein
MRRFVTIAFAGIFVVTSPVLAAPRARDAAEPVAGDQDQMVCKKFTKTGTLAGSYRTCKTKGEWERERANIRQMNVSNSCATSGQSGAVNPVPGQGNTWDC